MHTLACLLVPSQAKPTQHNLPHLSTKKPTTKHPPYKQTGPLAGLAASLLLFLLGLHLTPPVFIPEHAVSDASLLR